MVQLMNWAGTETIQAEELTVIPGLDEIFALIDVKTHVESGQYDVLVVDCAPTAETLRLLSLPEIMNWYIERIWPVERKVVKAVRPIVSRMTTIPIAGDQVFAAVERLHANLDAVKDILTDENDLHRAAGRQPREDGDQRGSAHVHLPRSVRVPGRRGRSRTASSRRT